MEKRSSGSSMRLGPCCVLSEPSVNVGLRPLTLLMQSAKPGSLEASFSLNSRCTASVCVRALFYADISAPVSRSVFFKEAETDPVPGKHRVLIQCQENHIIV